MKIDRVKLIELLEEKTGMNTVEVENQLKQLIDRILDAAERGKALEVKEFGMFYFNEYGDLKFDPSDELSAEINFKYAGMEHVELQPARDQAPDEDTAPDKDDTGKPQETKKKRSADAEDVFGLGRSGSEYDEEEMPVEDEATGPDGGALVSPPDEVERDIDPFSGLLNDASSKLKGPDEPGEKSGEPEPDEEDPFSFEFDETPEEEDETPPDRTSEPEQKPVSKKPKEPLKKKSYPSSGKTVKKDKKRDPIMMVISIGLVIVLVAAGYFVIPSLFESAPEPQPPTETEQTPPPEEVPDEAGAVLTEVEPPQESEVIEEQTPEPEVAAEPEQPIYGLMGELVDEANDGFSIVLHSLQSEERARTQAAEHASEGYRVLVTPRTINGETVWRVSVGQFPTLEEAQGAAEDLPSPYSSNNFIQRIQTN